MSVLILVFTICLLSEFLVGLILGLYVFNPQVKEVINKMSELGDALAAVRDQLAKATTEIVNKIAELQNTQNIEDAKAIAVELKTMAQALDDVVPDNPV
jgi:hypothetical protein